VTAKAVVGVVQVTIRLTVMKKKMKANPDTPAGCFGNR
jgi:hypothetical protein